MAVAGNTKRRKMAEAMERRLTRGAKKAAAKAARKANPDKRRWF